MVLINKRGVMDQKVIILLIALVLLVVIVMSVPSLRNKIWGAISQIKNFFRF